MKGKRPRAGLLPWKAVAAIYSQKSGERVSARQARLAAATATRKLRRGLGLPT